MWQKYCSILSGCACRSDDCKSNFTVPLPLPLLLLLLLLVTLLLPFLLLLLLLFLSVLLSCSHHHVIQLKLSCGLSSASQPLSLDSNSPLSLPLPPSLLNIFWPAHVRHLRAESPRAAAAGSLSQQRPYCAHLERRQRVIVCMCALRFQCVSVSVNVCSRD